jgi:hypothetical protein
MIVRRSIHPLKPGKGQEAVDLIKETLSSYPIRIYTSQIGPTFGTLAIEMEFESLADLEKATAEFNASAEGAAFFEKWYEVTKRTTGHAEIWTLRE